MKNQPLRCVVLEDEDDIRNWILKKLEEYPEIEVVGDAATIDDAYRLIASTRPDVAFMDVQLIGGDAFKLLSRLQSNGLPIPYIVMATGYPEYVMTALNDYRRYVVQYLLKPFVENWKDKFRKAIDALMAAKMKDAIPPVQTSSVAQQGSNEPPQTKETSTFLQNKGSLLRLDYKNISYLEAAGGGESIIVRDEGNIQVDKTLNKMTEILPDNFFRVSRTNVINMNRVLTINRGDRTVEIECKEKNKSVGISDNYYNDLLDKLPLAKNKFQG